MEKSSIRWDLQGIRGLAIIEVVLFHYYPNICPNGHIGVDQFFVLSGFLMCMLLQREKGKSAWSLFSSFYVKRFKRLLPLYFLFIFCTVLAIYLFFPLTVIETNQASATSALFFTSNRAKTSWEQYAWALSMLHNVFMHTWSLSAEFQFYFLIPVVFWLGPTSSHKMQCIYYSVLALVSFIAYQNYYIIWGHYNVFMRFWQFLIGFLVYLAQSKMSNEYKLVDNQDRKVMDHRRKWLSQGIKYAILAYLMTFSFFKIRLPRFFGRPFVTMITGVLMLVSHEDPILSNRVLTYIGDISYSWYLVHWPLFVYWEITSIRYRSKLFIAFLASIAISVISYETFEKWYRKQRNNTIGILIGVLFLSNLALINEDDIRDYFHRSEKNQTRLDGLTDAMTLDDAGEMNYLWNVNSIRNLLNPLCTYEGNKEPFGWCRHQELSPGAKYKVALIGNGWAANHVTLFRQECGPKMNSVLQGVGSGCEPFFPTWNNSVCVKEFKEFELRIKEEKPDIVFILSRYLSVGKESSALETADSIYETMKNQTTKMLESINKKLYILNVLPRVSTKNPSLIVEMLKNGENATEVDKALLDWTGYKVAQNRIAQLIKECGEKCQLIDYTDTFFNRTSSSFRYFDERGFSYFTLTNDLSPRGLEQVRPVWKELCNKL